MADEHSPQRVTYGKIDILAVLQRVGRIVGDPLVNFVVFDDGTGSIRHGGRGSRIFSFGLADGSNGPQFDEAYRKWLEEYEHSEDA